MLLPGSGALGIEALSRGAHGCTFIERDRVARDVLEHNLASLSLKAPRVRVVAADSFDAAAQLASNGPFGLVLLDPPYAEGPARVHELLGELIDYGKLAHGCVIVYEHALPKARRPLPKSSSWTGASCSMARRNMAKSV